MKDFFFFFFGFGQMIFVSWVIFGSWMILGSRGADLSLGVDGF
jgi:hypothetical protein